MLHGHAVTVLYTRHPIYLTTQWALYVNTPSASDFLLFIDVSTLCFCIKLAAPFAPLSLYTQCKFATCGYGVSISFILILF